MKRQSFNPSPFVCFLMGATALLVGILVMESHSLSGTWRYKVTVAIDTPEGIKKGASVYEVYAKRQFSILSVGGETVNTFIAGQAVVVDLGARGVLFGLMNGGGRHVVYNAFPFVRGAPLSREGVDYYKGLYQTIGGKKVILKPEIYTYPTFVMFRDRGNPKTVMPVLERQQVEGASYPLQYKVTENHFEALFGKGVKLKEVTVEMTDEILTENITEWIPWIPEYYNSRLDGHRFGTTKAENRLANDLSSGSFLVRPEFK